MKLSRAQERLYYALEEFRGQDVSIDVLYKTVYPDRKQNVSNRHKQQHLGSFIHRINAKLEGERIAPGVARRTYRLSAAVNP